MNHRPGGGVVQVDGEYIPNNMDVGGANYFDRESRIMHVVSLKSFVYNGEGGAQC